MKVITSNWRDEALQLPLADLKKIYEHKKKMRKLSTSTPFVFSLCAILAATIAYLLMNVSNIASKGQLALFFTAVAISVVALIWRYIIAFSTKEKKGSNIVLIISAVELVLQVVLSHYLSTWIYLAFSILISIYLILIRPYVIQADRDIDFLRSMPTFPFNERISSQMFEVAEQKRKMQLIESAKGNIYSDNAEQIFEMPVPEPPQYEKGDTPEDYLQRKHMYIDGKFTKTSLTDEEYDRQEDELYERRMFTDRKKKAEGLPIAPEAIPDDGTLQNMDYNERHQPNADEIVISQDVFAEDFERLERKLKQPKEDDIKVSDDVQLEDFDFSDRQEQ